MKILYTDIDFVLSLSSERTQKLTKWGYVHRFNAKAVNVYNEILEKTGAYPVITSDWKDHWTLQQLKEIFVEWAGISIPPIDVTPSIPGVTLQRLKEWRAMEILKHVEEHKPESWVAIDDLYLSAWIPDEHFVYLPRSREGIKQSSKKEEIIKKLNT